MIMVTTDYNQDGERQDALIINLFRDIMQVLSKYIVQGQIPPSAIFLDYSKWYGFKYK